MANIEEAIRRLKFLYEQHGAETLIAAQKAVADSTTGAERAALSLEKQFNNLERRMVPTVRAQQEYERVQRQVGDALKQNPALQARANVVLENAAKQYQAATQGLTVYNKTINQGTGEARLARHELINLSRQIQDVGVGLASGQSPFTILVQQGSQIADVFATSSGTLKGFFTQAVGGAARFMGSAAGIATTVGTMGAAIIYAASSYSSGQKEIERSLMGIGRASGVTRDQINTIAETSKSAFGLSTSEARTAATAFAATGKIYQENVGAATRIIDSYARAGGDATEVTKMLAGALQDPAAGALELNKQLGFLDATTLNYIRSLQAAGNLQEAQAVLMRAAAPSIQKAAEATGFWAKAWNLATNSASEYFDMIGKIALRAAEGVTGIETGGYSKAEEYQRARAKLDERRKYTGPLARPGIEAQEQVVSQKEQALIAEGLEKTATRLRQLSLEADTAARSFMPLTAEIENTLKAMNRLQEQRLTSGGEVTGAEKVGSVKLLQLEQENAALVRQAEVTSAIALMYPGMTIEGAKQLYNLQQQTVAAQAVGTAGQLQAQQQMNINMMTAQGMTLQQATAIAVAQTALAQAQINAQAQQTLVAAQGNLSIAQARGGAEKIVATEHARIQQLLAQQVPLEKATQIAATERAAAEEKVREAIENQIKSLNDQVRLHNAREQGIEAAVKAEIAYKRAIDAGSSPELAAQLRDATLRVERINEAAEAERQLAQEQQAAAQAQQNAAQQASQQIAQQNAFLEQQEALYWEIRNAISFAASAAVYFNDITGEITHSRFGNTKQFTRDTGILTQFDPAGYQSTITAPIGANTGPLADRINEMLGRGESLQGALLKVLEEDPLSQIAASITDLLSKDQQAQFIQAQIGALRAGPRSLESEMLIKQLNDKLTQLSQSTDALNSTMQNALSPYYSQDPRTTKLGFRAGLRANPDWMTGATNESPVVAVLGPGAIQPKRAISTPGLGGIGTLTGGAMVLPPGGYKGGGTGFASGGSFIVPGGYSGNDNKMVSFPAASGEQVVVNRRPGGAQPSVVNVDNRVVINGSVDEDTLSRMKTTRFQQTQRMRSAMSAA